MGTTIEVKKERNHRTGTVILPFSSFLMANLNTKTGLKEMAAMYEATGVKLTPRGYRKAARKLAKQGKITIERYEQLYLFPYGSPTDENGTGSMNGLKITIEGNRTHSTHRTLLSMPYQGAQPTIGATYVKPFGRYGTARQAVYRSGNITIIAYQKKLNVWVHKPPGVRTGEQLIEAKVQGYRALRSFAQAHTLTLEGYLNRVLFSHHVVENDALNAAIKELIAAYPQIEARLGSKVCETSHKGRVEHEGKARADRIIRGDQVAAGLEYLTIDYPNQFADFMKLVPDYHAQLKLHLEVEARTLDAIKELTKAIREGKVV
jgi:hypothetical protein